MEVKSRFFQGLKYIALGAGAVFIIIILCVIWYRFFTSSFNGTDNKDAIESAFEVQKQEYDKLLDNYTKQKQMIESAQVLVSEFEVANKTDIRNINEARNLIESMRGLVSRLSELLRTQP